MWLDKVSKYLIDRIFSYPYGVCVGARACVCVCVRVCVCVCMCMRVHVSVIEKGIQLSIVSCEYISPFICTHLSFHMDSPLFT